MENMRRIINISLFWLVSNASLFLTQRLRVVLSRDWRPAFSETLSQFGWVWRDGSGWPDHCRSVCGEPDRRRAEALLLLCSWRLGHLHRTLFRTCSARTGAANHPNHPQSLTCFCFITTFFAFVHIQFLHAFDSSRSGLVVTFYYGQCFSY